MPVTHVRGVGPERLTLCGLDAIDAGPYYVDVTTEMRASDNVHSWCDACVRGAKTSQPKHKVIDAEFVALSSRRGGAELAPGGCTTSALDRHDDRHSFHQPRGTRPQISTTTRSSR